MSKRCLSKDLIISKAFDMIDEIGVDNFSIRQLAKELGVQVSSLYNHIDNERDLLLEVSKSAAELYVEIITKTIDGVAKEDAPYVSGDAFREFATKHKYLYELLIDSRWIGDKDFEKVNKIFTQPIDILTMEGITDIEDIEITYIAMRVVTHGFSSLDANGVFDNLNVDKTKAYHFLIKNVVDMMEKFSKKNK